MGSLELKQLEGRVEHKAVQSPKSGWEVERSWRVEWNSDQLGGEWQCPVSQRGCSFPLSFRYSFCPFFSPFVSSFLAVMHFPFVTRKKEDIRLPWKNFWAQLTKELIKTRMSSACSFWIISSVKYIFEKQTQSTQLDCR